MPNVKDFTLRASAAATSGGTGSAVDVEMRTYSEVTLDVTVIDSATLDVTIESSPTLSAWKPLGYFRAITTLGTRSLIIPDGDRYLRAIWSVTGTSVTFVVTCRSHQLYCLPKDMGPAGLTKQARDSLTVLESAQACLTASSEAEGYLAPATTLPIAQLDEATRMHIARMAVFEAARPNGLASASSGKAAVIEIGRSDALKWLTNISTGKVVPPGLIDATPDVPEAGGGNSELLVISTPSRRW